MENKNNYDSLSHSKFKIRYHIIFSTKYRRKLLRWPFSDTIKAYMLLSQENQSDYKIELIEIDQSKPDHIHLLVQATPNIAPCDIIHKLKQFSTYMCYKNNSGYMYKWYGIKHYLWTRGYFCCTIGDASISTIQKYIENQG